MFKSGLKLNANNCGFIGTDRVQVGTKLEKPSDCCLVWPKVKHTSDLCCFLGDKVGQQTILNPKVPWLGMGTWVLLGPATGL